MKKAKTEDEQLLDAYLRQLDDHPNQQTVTVSRQHYQWLAQTINALKVGLERKGGKASE
jgi:hypothetical protein